MNSRLNELHRIGVAVSRETVDKLEQFESDFRKWSTRINLAAPSTLDSLWRRHILDSAQILPLAPQARKWLDLGSGGGFPGAIIAILLAERDDACIELVESNNKKAAFLRSILSALSAPAVVHVCRIEDAPARVQQPDIVTARALAPLPLLLDLASPWLGGGSRALFHKGRDYAAEVRESRIGWQFDLIEHQSKIDSTSRILEISGLDVQPAK